MWTEQISPSLGDAVRADRQLHRFASDGQRGADAGGYVLHLEGIPAGAFGCWPAGISETWQADIGRAPTPEELAAYQATPDAMRRERDADADRRAEEAAEGADTLRKEAP